MVGSLGIAFTAPSGVTAIRAMYGGFLIGAGLLFGLAAWDPRMHGSGWLLSASSSAPSWRRACSEWSWMVGGRDSAYLCRNRDRFADLHWALPARRFGWIG
ncbi:MAG: hypothetical protein WDM81_18035 [Rhizomicrobium sp.]